MKLGKIAFCLLALTGILFNHLPLAAQIKPADEAFAGALEYKPQNAAETFRALSRAGKTAAFTENLVKILGAEDAATVDGALEAQGAFFYENFAARAARSFEKMPEKSKAISRRLYEELKLKTTPPVKKARAASENRIDDFQPSRDEKAVFTDAAYNLYQSDEPEVKTVETDTTIEVEGAQTKTIEMDQGTVTRAARANEKAGFDGRVRSAETVEEETIETVSKSSGAKLSKNIRVSFGASFAACPDDAGIVRGKGKSVIHSQTIVNTGGQLAALATDYTLDFNVTAHVDDEAEMTDFDLEGTLTEKTFGYDRAARLGLITNADGISDGTRRVDYRISGNTPPTTATDQYGFKTSVSPVLGKVSSQITGIKTNAEATRIAEAGRAGLGGMMLYLERLMRASIAGWQSGECVEVECTAAKQTLAPNESVSVKAASVSRQDLGKFSARLHASGTASVTPEDSRAAPYAVYTLTAPAKEAASVSVKSVSRRGIGWGSLEIPVARKTSPVKTPQANATGAGWRGKIVYETRYRRDSKDGAPVYGAETVEDSLTKIVEIAMDGDARRATARMSVDGKRVSENEMRQKRCCRSGGLGRCGRETVQIVNEKRVVETYGSGTTEVMGFVNVRDGMYSLEFTVADIKGTTKISSTRTASGMCVEAENKTETTDAASEITFPPTVVKAFGAINAETPNILKGELQIDADTRIVWELARVAPRGK